MSLTAIIHTRNSEKTVEAALQSVLFANEIIVVDMHSSDKTKAIAKKYATEFYLFDDVGYVEPARNFALEKVKTDWVLLVDADEVVPSSLSTYIVNSVANAKADAYFIARSNSIFGKEIENQGWWPDYQLRLFKKGVVSWEVAIHSVPIISGTSEYFPAEKSLALFHLNYTSVTQFIDRMNNYTSIQAKEKGELKKVDVAMLGEQFRTEFLSRLFSQQAIDEGMHGVALSYLQAFSEVAKVLKRWEASGFPNTQADQKVLIKELRQFQRELSYWISDWEAHHGSPLDSFLARIRRKLQW